MYGVDVARLLCTSKIQKCGVVWVHSYFQPFGWPTLTLTGNVGHGWSATHVDRAISRSADYTLRRKRNAPLKPASAICCDHHHCCTQYTRPYRPPTPINYNDTYSRPYRNHPYHVSLATPSTERDPKCDARHHDAPTSPSQQHSAALPIALRHSLVSSAHLVSRAAPLHLSHPEVAKLCDSLGHRSSRKCSRHHKSR